jgi:hypothetical protein
MTYHEEDDTVSEFRVRVEEDGVDKLGHYVKLTEDFEVHRQETEQESSSSPSSSSSCGQKRSVWFWIKLGLFFTFLTALGLAGYKWLYPLIMDKVFNFLQ